MKLRTKLIILYAFSAIVIMLALGGLFYYKIRKERLRSIREDISNQLELIDFTLNGFFNDVENDVNALAADKTVRSRDDRDFTSFLDADEKTYQYHIRELEQRIIDILNNYRVTHPYVNSVYIGNEVLIFIEGSKACQLNIS